MRRTLAFAMLLALVAGCVDTPASEPRGPIAEGTSLPPGCDPGRPALAHRAGVLVEVGGARTIPCASLTGYPSYEPTIGVSPSTGAVFFFPAETSRSTAKPDGVGVMRSTDQGATWEFVLPSTAGRTPHVADLDPFLYVDPATARVFADTLATVNCSILSWSDDEGATWEHSGAGCMETDHQTIFAGPPVSSTTVGYPNVVYRCAMNAVAFSGASTMSTCQRSLDGGRSWLPPGAPAFVGLSPGELSYCDGAVGHGVADARGRIYLPKGLCGEPWLAMSDDEGLSWTRVRISDLGMHRGPSGSPGHDVGVGIDLEGNVYALWIAEDRLPRLAVSRDGGATWSPPRPVAPPAVRETTLPAFAVGGVGKVAILYLGSENSPGAPFPSYDCGMLVCVGAPPSPPAYDAVTWNGYIATSVDALADAPTFLTLSVNDPADPLVRGACTASACPGVWDFLDITIAPDGTAWGAFVDACEDACVSGGQLSSNDAGGQGLVGRAWGGPSLLDN